MLLCDTDYDMECQINLVGGKMIPFELQVDLEKFLEKETEDTASTIPYLEVWSVRIWRMPTSRYSRTLKNGASRLK